MLKTVVNFLNLKLGLLNYFDLTRCLSELKVNNEGLTSPKEYISNGNWDNIDFDSKDGVSYWRLRDEITTSPIESIYKAGKRVEVTIPLKLVFSVPRRKLTEDDAYAFDRIRQTITKQFNIDDGDLKNTLGCEKVEISSPTANGDAKEVWDGETENTGTHEPNYDVVFGSVDIDVKLIYKGTCLPTECDDVDSDILHSFDFCNAAVRDRLTAAQITCLEDALCGVCVPVTEQINGVTIGTVASGGTNNQLIQDSAGASVGTEANPSVIGDSTVTINSTSLGATGSIVAEGSVDLVVNLDGSPSGSWDGNSWEVTSAACDDATVENSDASYSTTVASGGTLVVPDTAISANGDLVINQPSTIAKDITVRYDTQGTVATTISGGEIVVPDVAALPSLSIGVFSDAGYTTPVTGGAFGDTVYIKLYESNITPTGFTISFDGDSEKVINQAGGTYTWVIDVKGTVTINASARDGSDGVANATPFTFTTTNAYVGGKAVLTDGTSDRVVGNVCGNNYYPNYGIGFMFNDPTSAVGSAKGLFGYGTSLGQNNYNGFNLWCFPNQTRWYLNMPDGQATNYVINFSKDVDNHLYLQVGSSNVDIYLNGSLYGSFARTSALPLGDPTIIIGGAVYLTNPHACKYWQVVATDGSLDATAAAALSTAGHADTDPSGVSGVIEVFDFGRTATGVPSTDPANPTIIEGMVRGSSLYCNTTFTSPSGIVAL